MLLKGNYRFTKTSSWARTLTCKRKLAKNDAWWFVKKTHEKYHLEKKKKEICLV